MISTETLRNLSNTSRVVHHVSRSSATTRRGNGMLLAAAMPIADHKQELKNSQRVLTDF